MFNFGKTRELKARIETLESECAAAKSIGLSYAETIKEQAEKLKVGEVAFVKVQEERDKLKKIVREQTEADLLINSLKAVGIIREDKKVDYFAEDSRLRALSQQAGMMNTSNPYGYSAFGGIFGALGAAQAGRFI